MMARVRNKDSKAELALRRALHAAGVRYRLHAPDVTGRPDLVIRSRRLAVFVDGDLWHGNPEEIRRRGRDSLGDLFPTGGSPRSSGRWPGTARSPRRWRTAVGP
jgi:DNA mismatch endonuclease (patch repair protein)